MRYFNLLIVAAVVQTLAARTVAAAPPRQGRVELGVFAGYTLLSADNQLGNAPDPRMRPGSGPVAGLRGSYHLSTPLALELEADYTRGTFEDSGLDASVVGWRGSALWHFGAGAWRPFVLAGAGALSTVWREYGTEHDTDLAGHVGAGVKCDWTERLGLRADLRYYGMDGAESALSHNFAALIGISVRLDSPLADADGDGVGDAADKCPGAAEDADGHADADGCPDPDNDGDGTLDTADRCPDQAEDKDGFSDADGCPDPDNDDDGTLDAADRCPLQAEDKDGFEDADGCPDGDNDKDGIADAQDKCPGQSGSAEDQGCPPSDKDDDGIPDKLDKCPDKKETFNGKDDGDGCPDGEETVVVSKGHLKILQKIYFELGNAEIKPESYKLLDTVAAALVQHARLSKVAIEGHTDDLGGADDNQGLSQQRAEAVVNYLAGKGIARGRLVAEGHGSNRPLCTDLAELLKSEAKHKRKIEACREQNRRVQFRVLEVDGAAVPAAKD